MLRLMITALPESPRHVTHDQWLPLHYAARYCASKDFDEQMLALLIDAHPDGAAHRNNNDSMPLHLLCGSELCKLRPEMVRVLVAAAPHVLREPNKNRNTPLHLLCNQGSENLNVRNLRELREPVARRLRA